MEPRSPVLGNHDEKHLRWRRHEARKREKPGYRNPMHPLSVEARRTNEALSDDDWAYIESFPFVGIRLDDSWVVVHAGFLSWHADRGAEASGHAAPAICRHRRPIPVGRGPGAAPGCAGYWTDLWQGPESVVFGHAVQSLESPRQSDPAPGVRCLGIDTGCCFGGRLSCVVFPSGEIVQVSAREAYCGLAGAEDA